MNLVSRLFSIHCATLCLCSLLVATQSAFAGQNGDPDGLIPFESIEGEFRIHLPGTPIHDIVELDSGSAVQHQYKMRFSNGAFLVSFQDNSKLVGETDEEGFAELEQARDGVVEHFGGKLISNTRHKFGGKHLGLQFRMSIPESGGEYQCQFLSVGDRFYQIIAIGVPEFVRSNRTLAMMTSFTIMK